MIDIFAYLDYREFLHDLLSDSRSRNVRWLTYRGLARRSDLDPSLLSKIIKGKRNLSSEQALRITDALKFNKQRREYFELLVRFNQACHHDTKRLHFDKLLALRRPPEASPVTREQYEFYSKWYYTAVRELLHFHPSPNSPASIAKALYPPISSRQAREALNLLAALGIVRPLADGKVELQDTFITSGTEIDPFAIRSFQAQMITLAREALERFTKENREISTQTLSLSKDGFKRVREAVRELQERLRVIAHNDKNVDGVYQINFQAFPLCRPLGSEDGTLLRAPRGGGG